MIYEFCKYSVAERLRGIALGLLQLLPSRKVTPRVADVFLRNDNDDEHSFFPLNSFSLDQMEAVNVEL